MNENVQAKIFAYQIISSSNPFVWNIDILIINFSKFCGKYVEIGSIIISGNSIVGERKIER